MTTPPFDPSEWLATRTYRALDHAVGDLVRRKTAAGLSVSVVVPARNEEATVAGVVEAISALSETLVDELVVMDGGSTDATAERAAAAGARVHDDRTPLASFGRPSGKGDALWRSLAVTSGDIVAFVDADIRNPDPAFVSGLLVPLLHEPDVQLVKAFYDRPVEVEGALQATGGGRVTELLARPLLNLFWPRLAGLVQPLSGEYAGRRDLLEALPFFTGYGVELGMLVDTLTHSGPEAIAQVDVGERVHRNQELADLSRMAFAIAQVAVQRLDAEGRVEAGRLFEEGGPPADYLQFARDPEGSIAAQKHEVRVVERPPLGSVPESDR